LVALANKLMVSPIMPENTQLIADQVLFVDKGRIALQGKPDILQNSDHLGLLRYLGRAG
jgi:thiamine transport system ATP-binding protein